LITFGMQGTLCCLTDERCMRLRFCRREQHQNARLSALIPATTSASAREAPPQIPLFAAMVTAAALCSEMPIALVVQIPLGCSTPNVIRPHA
jgi:hypothetical protein